MRHPLLLIISLVAAIVVSEKVADAKTRAAVMPLAKGAGGAEYVGLGRSLADMMVTDLGRADILQLVERTQLVLILDELKLAKNGYLDKRTAQKIGKGLGAEFIITGTFSVVGKQFTITCRMFSVKTSDVVASANSTGNVGDFVAIEKDVVEQLLRAMKVKLGPAARRTLLLDTPTESAKALASYGRGVDAKEKGNVKVAQREFETALRQDPDFAKASIALRDLGARVKSELAANQQRFTDRVLKAKLDAIRAIPAETRRSAKFVDTYDSMMDFSIRQELLGRVGQHCRRFAELRHYLIRRKGKFQSWFAHLPGTPSGLTNFATAAPIIERRGKQLGIVGPLLPFSHGGDMMHSIRYILSSGGHLINGGSISPARDSLLSAMAECYSPAEQVREFDAIVTIVKKWNLYSQPNSTGSDRKAITLRDALQLHWALLRAQHRGFDQKILTRTDAVLVRHPVGDPGRVYILRRIEDIVRAAESFEKSRASRMGMTEAQVVDKIRKLIRRDPKSLNLAHPLCKSFISFSEPHTEAFYNRYQKQNVDRRSGYVDTLGEYLAPFELAHCFRSRNKKPMSVQQLLQIVGRGLRRPHPAKGKEDNCKKGIATASQLLQSLQRGAPTNRDIYGLVFDLHKLRKQRCLAQ